MYDDLHLFVAFGLGDGSAGEDRDGCDIGGVDHMVENCAADEAGCAGEDEMHIGV